MEGNERNMREAEWVRACIIMKAHPVLNAHFFYKSSSVTLCISTLLTLNTMGLM